MSSVQDAHFNNISWPSLYNPVKEVGFTGPAVRPGGYYLSDLDDIFRFTFYWTLIFHIPFSLVAGAYAFFNFLFPPPVRGGPGDEIVLASLDARPKLAHPPAHSRSHSHAYSHSQSLSHPHSQSHHDHDHDDPPTAVDEWLKPRINARRSRWMSTLLVLFTFLGFSLLSAVVGAAVMALVLAGVYRAGGFYMSTWIPFIWAVIQSLIALLEIWPSTIDII